MVFRIDEKEKRNPKTDIVIHSWPWSGQQKPLVKIQSAQVVNIRSAATLGLLAIAIAWLLVNAEKYKNICKYTFVTAFVAGMAVQCLPLAQACTRHFQDETMQKHSPFNVYLELRSRVANIPKDQVIYLEIPFEHYKVTEMVSYVLSDRKLAGKYEDGYFIRSIPEHERDMPAETADWIIQLKRVPEADENPLDRIGPFLIRRAPASTLVK